MHRPGNSDYIGHIKGPWGLFLEAATEVGWHFICHLIANGPITSYTGSGQAEGALGVQRKNLGCGL